MNKAKKDIKRKDKVTKGTVKFAPSPKNGLFLSFRLLETYFEGKAGKSFER